MEQGGRRESRNVEDRRLSGGGRGFGGGGGGRGVGGAGLGIVAIVVVGWFLGVDLTPLLDGQLEIGGPAGGKTELSAADQEAARFVSVTLAETEDIWAALFEEQVGQPYRPAVLVLYSGVTGSPCGTASGQTGPFYCPGDKKVYLDTDFFATMAHELGARGDFAQAYVVAHEIGHHVQDELGILGEANKLRAQVSAAQANDISVRIELQADCLAGIWGKEVGDRFGVIEPGDFEEAVNAAHQIGDDTLQKGAGRVPRPESFTHGTSAQRTYWFQRGLDSGLLQECDTFSVARL
jgi:predicted metalloprotease